MPNPTTPDAAAAKQAVPRKKTVYCLCVRPDDQSEWSEPGYYATRKKRDHSATLNRCISGMRTYSFEEKKTVEEIEELFA